MDVACFSAVGGASDGQCPILTDNAINVLRARYLKRGEDGVAEEPAELFRRVAAHVASAECGSDATDAWTDVFYRLMASGRFMPNSPTLMNAGRRLGLLSACFVLPVPDDTSAIFKSITDTATIQKAGGGTGFAFDELRPCGATVSSSGGESSGPLSFWRVFSEATSAIQQGSFRRGANMAIMSVDHPDIIKFLFAKQDLQQFENYNISVKVTDEFVRRVRTSPKSAMVVRWGKDSWFVPRSVVETCRKAVEDGRRGKSHPRKLDICYGVGDLVQADDAAASEDMLSVGDVMDIIVKNAWQTGEPGLFFVDRIRETEATPSVAKIQACNPCGEQPLMPHEACNLGSINLGKFVRPFDERFVGDISDIPSGSCSILSREEADKNVDWGGLKKTVREAVRFLDNVVSVNKYPTPEIARTCENNRKIGLGVMGFADALLRLGVPYDSEDGIFWGEEFMEFVNSAAIDASRELAAERGSFPWFTRNSRWDDPIRNACVTTVAPTGTISIIADCSGGVEPLFSFAFIRQVLDDGLGQKQKMAQNQPDFQRVAKKFGFDSEELTEHILSTGTLQDRDEVPEAIRRVFKTARDISPEWHIRMQSAFQQHVTSAVSKTINLPSDATVETVRNAYLLAHSSGCKGVTVYRDGCRSEQPMALKSGAAAQLPDCVQEEFVTDDNQSTPLFRNPSSVPSTMLAVRVRYKSTYGNLHMHISLEPVAGRFREREVFFYLGRSGGGVHEIVDGFGRLSSIILRLDCPLSVVIDQLHGHASRTEKPNGKTGALTSLPNELSLGLMEYFNIVRDLRDEDGLLTAIPSFFGHSNAKDVTPTTQKKPGDNGDSHKASPFAERIARNTAQAGMLRQPCPTPECPGELVYAEGCRKCLICGAGSC